MENGISLATLIHILKADEFKELRSGEALSFMGRCLINIDRSSSQNYQDIWALYESGFSKNGLFVEFGATNGVGGSNTYLLEKEFGWTGILAEPIPHHEAALRANRPNSQICTDCVYTKSGLQVPFIITNESDLSTIVGYGDDEHKSKRDSGTNILINTISLYDMLKKYNKGKYIDYLSIDTEGSEFDILQAFFNDNKNEYYIRTLTVEHNFNAELREKIHDLLRANGYIRKFTEFSRWDDFYIKDEK
jgi:FkbM family methyltransferase